MVNQQSPHYPSPQQAPPKKSGNGCVIALAIVGFLGVGALAAGAIGVYVFATSKTGKDIIDNVSAGANAVGGMAKAFSDGARAPGVAEVRELGCEQAFAMDVDQILKAAEAFDAGLTPKSPPTVKTIVMCQVAAFKTPPSCDAIAKAYVGAIGRASGEFAVTVSVDRTKGSRCSSTYAPDGTLRGTYTGRTPAVPAAP